MWEGKKGLFYFEFGFFFFDVIKYYMYGWGKYLIVYLIYIVKCKFIYYKFFLIINCVYC